VGTNIDINNVGSAGPRPRWLAANVPHVYFYAYGRGRIRILCQHQDELQKTGRILLSSLVLFDHISAVTVTVTAPPDESPPSLFRK